MTMRKAPEGTRTFTVDCEGHTAHCTVEGGKQPLLTVRSEFGTETTQVGGTAPEDLARMLLHEMMGK